MKGLSSLVFKKYKYYYLLAIFLSIVSSLALSVSPLLIGKIIDGLNTKPFTTLINLLIFFVSINLLSTLAKSASDYLSSTMSENMGHDIRELMLEDLVQVNSPDVVVNKKYEDGELITLFGRDVEAIWDMFGFGLTSFLSSLILIITFCCLVFYLNTIIGFVLVLTSVIFIIAFAINGKQIRDKFALAAPEYDQMTNLFTKMLSCISLIFSFNARNWISNKVALSSRNMANYANQAHKKSVVFNLFVGIINLSALAIVWFYFLNVQEYNVLTVGEFISILFYFNFVIGPLEQIGESSKAFQKGFVSLKRINNFFESNYITRFHTKSTRENLKKSNGLSVYIEKFKINDKTILEDVLISANNGSLVGLAGKSGSGKTSILKLISRLYEGDFVGDIDLNGTSIFSISENLFREKCVYLPQNSNLLPLSLLDNIFFDKEKKNIDSILRNLQLDFLVKNESENLSNLGLSGGEEQRVHICRVLIGNFDLILLDEPTSALDKQNREIVRDTLKQLAIEGAIVIVSTHDVSLLESCDNIFFVEKGVVIDSGNHKNLYNENDKYKSLISNKKV